MSKKIFILSDETKNSHGFIVDSAKLDLSRFKLNPVMLYNHDQLVGRWEDIEMKDGKLTATPVFMDEAGEELSQKVSKRVDKGFVKGASLGINITAVEHTEGEVPRVSGEVLEVSVVDIPSNANAIVLYDSNGAKLTGSHLQLALEKITKFPQTITSEMKFKSETYKALGLQENATQEQIDDAVKRMSEKLAAAQSSIEAEHKLKVKTMLDKAIADGKLKADDRKIYEDLADVNFELATKTFASLPAMQKLAGQEQHGSSTEDRSKWTFADWRKKDTAGLLKLKADKPDEYAEIIKK